MTPTIPSTPAAPDAPPLHPRRIFGWRPDTPDIRDKVFDLRRRLRKLKGRLPRLVDLRQTLAPYDGTPALGPVLNQGDLGSCTANAGGKCYAFQHAMQGMAPYTVSRLFVYYGAREIEGTISVDAGAEIRDAMKVMDKLGSPNESVWPYQIGRFTQRPAQRAYDDAVEHNALAYESIPVKSLDVRTALASGHPVVVGFTVYSSFYRIGSDGMMPIPDPRVDRVEGGHAVLVVGYKWISVLTKTRRGMRKVPRLYAVVMNSWGSDWADGGFFYMPMAWLCCRDNADDFWTVTIAEEA